MHAMGKEMVARKGESRQCRHWRGDKREVRGVTGHGEAGGSSGGGCSSCCCEHGSPQRRRLPRPRGEPLAQRPGLVGGVLPLNQNL